MASGGPICVSCRAGPRDDDDSDGVREGQGRGFTHACDASTLPGGPGRLDRRGQPVPGGGSGEDARTLADEDRGEEGDHDRHRDQGQTVSATISALGLKVLAEGEVKVDDKVSPKRVDWVNLTTPDGHEFPQLLGIYELDGNRLKIRSGGLNDDRPKVFEPGDGYWGEIAVFERP